MEEDGGARSKLGPGGGGADLISSLPEDLLLRVLVHLRCARAAARTSVLSRRWRGLWTHLPKVTVTLRDVPLGSIEAAVDRATRAGVYHYLLDIRVPGRLSDGIAAYGRAEYDARVSALLLATASLSPTEFRFTVPLNTRCSPIDVRLDDRFRRATSIKLHNLGGTVFPTDSALPGLDRLSLSGCSVDLAALVLRCPHLRVLRVAATCFFDGNITIRSASLQELLVPSIVVARWTSRIDIETPVLKQLTLSFRAGKPRVSVLAPVVENISWRCLYTGSGVGFSIWCLLGVSLRTAAERSDARGLLPGNGEDAYLHLPRGNVLSLHMYAQDSFSFGDAELRFATELEKHMVTDFSGLELHLRAAGHMFGAIVLRLLAMHRVRTATRSLKIVLLRSEVKDFCHVNCICDEPQSWRTQTTSFTNLENVEIKGFEGEDHEFDFLKLIFRCTPMLKRLTVSLLDGATSSNGRSINKIYDIFKAYPFVECNVDLSSGSNANDIVHPGVEEVYPEAEDPAGFGALDAPDEGGEPAYDDSYFVDEDYEF